MGITSDPIQDRMGSWPRNVTASRPRAYLIPRVAPTAFYETAG